MKKIVSMLICVSLLCLFSEKSFACFQLPHIYNGHEYSDAIEDTYTRSNDGHLIHATFYYNPNPDMQFYFGGLSGGVLILHTASSWMVYYQDFTDNTENIQENWSDNNNNGYGFQFGINNDYWQPFPMDTSNLFSSQDIVVGDFYFPANCVPLPAVTAPLNDEEGLIMTTSDYSNFATHEYFNALRINHSGVDLALSPTGTRTASQITAEKYVYPICDGTVEYIHNGGGLYSFVKIYHPNCNGQEVVAYYGHISVIEGLTGVTRDEPIGTVKSWRGNSHLHLTIDTQTDRNLSRINQVVCDYALDDSKTVTSLSNCSNFTGRLENNRILLRIGWGQVKTIRYKDSNGKTYRENLYLSKDAVRELGFMSFFDFYE